MLPVLADELPNHVLCSAEVGTSPMAFLTVVTNLARKDISAQELIASTMWGFNALDSHGRWTRYCFMSVIYRGSGITAVKGSIFTSGMGNRGLLSCCMRSVKFTWTLALVCDVRHMMTLTVVGVSGMQSCCGCMMLRVPRFQ